MVLLAQHVHINAGIGASGNQLRFVNSGTFDANSLYAAYSTLGGASAPPHLYQVAGFTFTALSPDPFKGGGPNNGHASPGAHLELQVVAVSGPPGGVFSLWQENLGNTTLQFSEPVGQGNGTNRFVLSENEGEPEADPYGHIHGRIFALSQPGLYMVGFRIVDTSTNGPEGGPVNDPSDIFYFYFQAGLTISHFQRNESSATVRFGPKLGVSYFVESIPALGGTNIWTEIAGPITAAGQTRLQTVTVEINATSQFFRIRSEEP